MKFRRSSRMREHVEINLASLIDVVFILLLFFVVTTTFTRETQLKVDLPEAASGTPTQDTELKQLEVTISADGTYALNGQVLLKSDLDSLMAALQKESSGDNSLPLTISADGKTPHQAVITAMDAAGKLGFAHLRITTVEPQPAKP
ncbi:ExbD/TolR family protein [Pseudomonas mangiferae]|uniref:Biopolymer transporter ExbD n=1 Tax=Pseudomonas mangiferae TaxID=2593654 RepID=A0A553GZF1_9PSED|nr:biopolymer transporter ExbD [Pseudomonas mangiferae]TRX74885.1 biopolymer transporter ExbD [Pseudomonas mangiferae]